MKRAHPRLVPLRITPADRARLDKLARSHKVFLTVEERAQSSSPAHFLPHAVAISSVTWLRDPNGGKRPCVHRAIYGVGDSFEHAYARAVDTLARNSGSFFLFDYPENSNAKIKA